MVVTRLTAADGVAAFAMNYLRESDTQKVQIDFAVYYPQKMSAEYTDEIKNHGGKILPLPPIRKIQAHCTACRQIFEQEKYDIVHDNTLLITIPLMIIAKSMNVPVRILHSHNSKLGETKGKEIRNRMLLPFLVAQASDYAACSSKAATAMFGHAPCTLIPNIINTEKFRFDAYSRESIRKKYNASNKIVICTVARIALQKNPYFAVDVIGDLYRKNHQIEYWWVGNGSLEEDLKNYVTQKGLDNIVRFWGEQKNVTEFLQGADIFFLPSKFEGLGICVLEAQACNLPCVVSTEIPNEAIIDTEIVTTIDLDQPSKIWADNILEAYRKNRDELKAYDKVKSSCYNNETGWNYLYSFYRSCLERG